LRFRQGESPIVAEVSEIRRPDAGQTRNGARNLDDRVRDARLALTDFPDRDEHGTGVTSIRSYRFGRIDVGGRSYTSDVIITPEGGVDTWWRNVGHSLAVEDLAPILAAKPDILVIGTGYLGRMIVSEGARHYLEAHGIAVREARTRQAVADFNRLQAQRARVAAALHLTC
jgi:hypothetical protein